MLKKAKETTESSGTDFDSVLKYVDDNAHILNPGAYRTSKFHLIECGSMKSVLD
jgi:hypothetical protein